MKYIKQFLIIVIVTALGETCHALIPLPIPGSIYGLLLMLVCLMTGIVKLHQVEDTAGFLISIMPILFIPATSALIDSWAAMRDMLVPLLVISIVTTFVVVAASGKVTDLMMRYKERDASAKDTKGGAA